jgi:hypothetical protein
MVNTPAASRTFFLIDLNQGATSSNPGGYMMVYFLQLSQIAKKSLGSGLPPSINATGEGGAKDLPQLLQCFQGKRTFQL